VERAKTADNRYRTSNLRRGGRNEETGNTQFSVMLDSTGLACLRTPGLHARRIPKTRGDVSLIVLARPRDFELDTVQLLQSDV
jgi:hypothetical protein